MLDDEDEEELAVLRAQRKARLGDVEGATRGELQKAYGGVESDSEDDGEDAGNAEAAGDATVADAEDASIPIEAFEQGFPMSFGKQGKKIDNVAAIHAATQRSKVKENGPDDGSRRPASTFKSFVGPARPPVRADDSFVGPPRPPAPADDSCVGPPRPPVLTDDSFVGPPRPPAAADDSFVGPPRPSESENESFVGPPRPPAADMSTDSFVGPPRPAVYGTASSTVSRQTDNVPIPPRPPAPASTQPGNILAASVPKQNGAEAAATDDYEPPRLPISNEIRLQAHFKLVSALDVDRTGSRVITGGYDYNLRMFDFNGMKSDFRPFRELQPHDGHPINALSFSPNGEAFLCVTGAAQPKIYDRDGRELGEFKRGDMYLRDLRNTKGHVAGCTHGQWNPKDRYTAMTASNDGTLRLWDAEQIEQKMVIKPSIVKPGRIPVTACCYSPDAALIAASLTDGTIQLWSATGSFGRAASLGVVHAPKEQMLGKPTWKYASGARQLLRDAHPTGTEVTDLAILRDGRTLLSRGDDATLKLWDLRMFKSPVHVWDDLPLTHSQTRLCVSPQEDIVLTGISGEKGGGGMVVALDLKTHALVGKVGMPGTVTGIKWSSAINHILVGTGDRSYGATAVLYDPMMSEKGALLCAGKRPRARDALDFMPAPIIHTPGALPLFRDDASRKRRRDPETQDGRAAMAPDAGPIASGAGGGGRIGFTNNTLLTQYVLEKSGMKKLEEQMDPREAILRHKDAVKEFSAFTKAYEKTQPKRLYAEPEPETGDDK